jgi:hypothetical protein
VSVLNLGDSLFEGPVALRLFFPEHTDQFGTYPRQEVLTIEDELRLEPGERSKMFHLGYLNASGGIHEFTVTVDTGRQSDCDPSNNTVVFSGTHVDCF